MKDEDAKLDQVLEQWHCPVQPSGSMESAVWKRIAEREEAAWGGQGTKVIAFRRRWAGPALAASVGLAAILAGIGAAEIRVQSGKESHSLQDPGQAYFESINPVALARHEHR